MKNLFKLVIAMVAVGFVAGSAQNYTLLSFNKLATSSSIESGELTEDNAFDGNMETRWSSEFSDNQWIKVDLGESYPIDKIALYWEVAYGAHYEVYGSNNAADWGTLLVEELNSNGDTDEFVGSYGTYRYITISGIKRGTQYGFSLFEVEIFSEDEQTTFIDGRDGQEYQIKRIGNQTWMAENLNFVTVAPSSCYNDFDKNCGAFGRLYNWDAAMEACPAGWLLPSSADWSELFGFVDTETGDPSNLGMYLKATNGWNGGITGAGNDQFGFSAYPNGYKRSNGKYQYNDVAGYWWTASERSATNAYKLHLYHWTSDFRQESVSKNNSFGVRCIKE